MLLSALFPTRDIGSDPAKIRDWAQAAEGLGFDCIEVADHVFGAAPRGDWKPTYSEHDPFHETFTTMAFIAAVTKNIKLCSGVLMRRLWTEELVTFKGKFHTLVDVTMLPAPVQRPIPIWFGGSSDAVVKRAARIGDGWMPILSPEAAEPKLAALREHLKAFGRDPAKFGLEGWLRMDEADPQLWFKAAQGWKRLGAQIVMLYPMYRMPELDRQIETLRRFKDVATGL